MPAVERWRAQPIPQEGISLDLESLTTTLRRGILPNPLELIRPLFKQVSGGQRVHFKDKDFPDQLRKVTGRFQTLKLPELRIVACRGGFGMQVDLVKSLKRRTSKIAKERGFRAVLAFSESARDELIEDVKTLESGVDRDVAQAQAAMGRSREAVKPLTTFIGSWGTDRKVQGLVADHLLDAMTNAVNGACKESSITILKGLIEELNRQAAGAQRVNDGAHRCLRITREIFESSRAGRKVTTDSQAEIDVSTQASDNALYERCRLESTLVLDHLGKSDRKTCVSRVEASCYRFEYVSIVPRHRVSDTSWISSKTFQWSMSWLLSWRTTPTRANALSRIEAAVRACQPLWRAETGQIGAAFADNVIVGIPESRTEIHRESVVQAVEDAATARMHPNGQYHGETSSV